MIPTLPFVKPKQCSFSKTFFLLFLFFLSLSLSLSLCLVVINNRSLKCQFLLCSRSCCTTSTSDDRPLLPYCSGNLSKLLHRLHSAQRQQKSDVDVLLRLQFRSFRLWVQQQLQQYCIFCRGKLDLGKCHLCCVIISSESYRCRVIHRLQECNHRCMPAVFIFIFFFHSSLRDSSSKRKHNYCHCHEFFFFFFTAITFLLIWFSDRQLPYSNQDWCGSWTDSKQHFPRSRSESCLHEPNGLLDSVAEFHLKSIFLPPSSPRVKTAATIAFRFLGNSRLHNFTHFSIHQNGHQYVWNSSSSIPTPQQTIDDQSLLLSLSTMLFNLDLSENSLLETSKWKFSASNDDEEDYQQQQETTTNGGHGGGFSLSVSGYSQLGPSISLMVMMILKSNS